MLLLLSLCYVAMPTDWRTLSLSAMWRALCSALFEHVVAAQAAGCEMSVFSAFLFSVVFSVLVFLFGCTVVTGPVTDSVLFFVVQFALLAVVYIRRHVEIYIHI